MRVLIVTGFLGAGKTTFIKELLKHTKRYTAVMENEFGDTNLDSREISGAADNKDMQVLEFMEGCVCCSKKDSFLYSILTVSTGIAPEYLIVEPSGVAKLSNILAGLEKVRYEKIIPVSPIVIVSAKSFFANMHEYRELMEDQILNAGHVIFSKTEGMDADELEEVKRQIHEINPEAKITESYRDGKSKEWWTEVMSDKELQTVIGRAGNGYGSGSADGNGYGSLVDNGYELTDGDDYGTGNTNAQPAFEQMTLECIEFNSVGALTVFCDDLLRKQYGDIARAKGVVKVGSDALRFDIADNSYVITGGEEPFQSVFIGQDIDREKLLVGVCKYERPKKISRRYVGKGTDGGCTKIRPR
jgi:G3E family GTPase